MSAMSFARHAVRITRMPGCLHARIAYMPGSPTCPDRPHRGLLHKTAPVPFPAPSTSRPFLGGAQAAPVGVHGVDQYLDVVGVHFRRDAVAQVEHMAGVVAEAVEHGARLARHDLG